ncbi:MAG: hypothetical protein M3O50_04750 [Myxococcota bacterium]|nr:hypothetical protein [Myxococcota bacterium]
MLRLASLAAVAMVMPLSSACAGGWSRSTAASRSALREPPLRALKDPTVHGSHLVPERLDEGHFWGVDPGGALRVIVAGVRVVSSGNGAIVAARERLPPGPSVAVTLPERMGGGFLFALGKRVWRADTWLSPLVPLLTCPTSISQVWVGLDRAYARSPQGTLFAFDPRTGVPAGLGPLPASPALGRLAALDGWHAVAIADLRGALVTQDAGATWRPLALPFQPVDVVVLDDAIAVAGVREGEQPGPTEWFEVRADGRTAQSRAAPSSAEHPERGKLPSEAFTRPFGPVPLETAVADGWPLADGTALVARDGVLARVSLADGSIAERIADAFPLNPARCHPLSRDRPADPGGVAFVCGEPRGRTAVYDFDALTARLTESKHFDAPREVLAFGNGALAVRGPCAASGGDASPVGQQVWCTMASNGAWSETTIRGQDVEGARIVLLADGRLVVVWPPVAEDLATARLTVMQPGHVSAVPIVFPTMAKDVARAVALGVWMDGFEERRPGILGGWIDTAGAVLGIELAVDGTARIGEYIRDAGGPLPSGRWAFGWTASRRGFETVDGGMTWAKGIDLPDPISSPSGLRTRACGPVGCIAAGWLRVGWGVIATPPAIDPSSTSTHSSAPAPPALRLECEPLSGPAPEPLPFLHGGGTAPSMDRAGRRVEAGVRGRGPTAPAWGTVLAFPGFSGQPGPPMRGDDLGVTIEVAAALDRALRNIPLARLYAWGPNDGDWDPLGRWQVRWQWPWSGWPQARSSASAPVPWMSLDASRRALGIGPGPATAWVVVPGDDPDHALLVSRHALALPTAEVFTLETDGAPVQVQRQGGEPFSDLDAAIRAAGRWYFATTQGSNEASTTVLWTVEGARAREVARVPRIVFETRPSLRLARRADGRALGIVVDGQGDGQPGGLRGFATVAMRWVAPIDLESSALRDPEPLAPTDFSDRTVALCGGEAGEDDGWEMDLPYLGAVTLRVGSTVSVGTVSLQSVVARMRLSGERACIEGVLGSAAANASLPADAFATNARTRRTTRNAAEPSIGASVLSGRARYALRCTGR